VLDVGVVEDGEPGAAPESVPLLRVDARDGGSEEQDLQIQMRPGF
jgi:hypothetical protein